ncbi:Autoinducer 2 sensor kinase/phosphatase LuxQ [Aquisphaera giovannonii]|uniref:histidine kinase n=1 Tax=Aquisphaera giovannonii TaxID=406548 RepID=A0A5B9VW22_9BACT|nr:PAS domain S-box protein [Aquisphaera giovannonii]QEH32147.1 Autoinducer 2 sensor kinase/phosphatase LuxQ [Aquisphaera giovannonii]
MSLCSPAVALGTIDPEQLGAALMAGTCLAFAAYLAVRFLRPGGSKVPYPEALWALAGFFLASGLSRLLDAMATRGGAPGVLALPLPLSAGLLSLGMTVLSCAAAFALAGLLHVRRPPCDPRQLDREAAARRAAEEALRRSEAVGRKLELVASRTDDAVVVTDLHGRIEWANDSFARMTGYGPDEVLGRSPGGLLQGPETSPATVAFMRARRRAGQGFRAEVVNYAKGGRKYWLSLGVQPIRDEDGRLTHFLGVGRDVTERKAAERRMQVQHATTQLLAGGGRLDETMPKILSTIGGMLDFDAAGFWVADGGDGGRLRAGADPWVSPRMRADGAGPRSLPGEALAARVRATGGSAWVADLAAEPEGSASRPDPPLRNALVVPVTAGEGGATLGVMIFFSRGPFRCDGALLQAMTTLGRQVGIFLERDRTQAELRRVNARLRAVLDASGQVSIIATDSDGVITVFNAGAERMLGYEASEVVGKATPLLYHDEREVREHAARLSAELGTPVEGFGAFVARARRGGREVGEWTYIRKDGTRLRVLLSVAAVMDSEGQVSGYLGAAIDLSDRQRAETQLRSSESRFRRLVEANILGVVVGGIEGQITDANDAFLEMVGYTRAEMDAGLLPWDAIIPESSALRLHLCRAELWSRGRCEPVELECRHRDGRLIPLLVGAAMLDEARTPCRGAPVVAFCLDVTERRRLEDELRRQAGELSEAAARKNEFLAMLGHELRNPLAPIRNAVRIMKRRGMDDPTLVEAREVIDHQVRQLAQLVDDLLEVSRVAGGKVRLHREVVDVATVVAFALETSRPAIDEGRHRLSIAMPPEPLRVDADPVRMAQVLANLLINAAKYTPEGGSIRLSVRAEDGHVAFRVRDNGIGIPPEMLSRVFDLFAQVDQSLDRSQGGLGLGLTLVKTLVEMHGGDVCAFSQGLGTGSELVVRLPLWTAPPAEGDVPGAGGRSDAGAAGGEAGASASPSGAAGAQAAPRPRRVLVVDDNVSSAETLKILLTMEGHEAESVHDGPSALRALEDRRHEVVLMDIGLPEMDGYEVARRIRARDGSGRPLLVAVTGYAEDEARRRSREAGFDHHLVKPVDPDIILALVSSMEWSDAPLPPWDMTRSAEDFAVEELEEIRRGR